MGNNCRLYSNIHIRSDSKIGNNCILHSGVVIGADGFGFISVNEGHIKIPQIGKVVIGNDVEIGANSTIDRGTVADTIVHDLCKFDNGVQIGHNVSVGKGCLLTAHVTIAEVQKLVNIARLEVKQELLIMLPLVIERFLHAIPLLPKIFLGEKCTLGHLLERSKKKIKEMHFILMYQD